MSAPDLSPAARALLDAARDGLSPDAAAIQRVRGKVVAAGGAASALAIKLGLAGVLAVVTIGAIVQRTHTESPMAPHLAVPSTSVEVAPPTVHEVAPPITEPAPIEMPVEGEPIEMAAAPMRRASLTVTEPIDLAREVALIDRAMAALAKNDPQRALATIKLHAVETRGHGQLAEDAAAIEIEALCRIHASPTTISAKLDAFDAHFPTSVQRARLSTRCQE